MKQVIPLILLSILIVYSSASFAAACQQTGNKLGLVGLGDTGVIRAKFSASNNECLCPEVRFKKNNADTKSVLSILIAAKMGDNPLRIDLKKAGACSSAFRVYFQ